MRGQRLMCRQHTVQRQPEPTRKFFLGDLAGLVVREEGREDAIAGFPRGYSVADLSDDSAHVRAGDDGVILADGFVVGVLAHAYYHTKQLLVVLFFDFRESMARLTLRITEVKGNSADLNENFTMARRRHGGVPELQAIQAFEVGNPLLDRHDC